MPKVYILLSLITLFSKQILKGNFLNNIVRLKHSSTPQLKIVFSSYIVLKHTHTPMYYVYERK